MAGIADALTVEWSPASDPFATAPTWVDITGDVETGEIDRGRAGAFDLYRVGTASFLVTNSTGGTPVIDPTVWYRWRQVRVTATATGEALVAETWTGSDGANWPAQWAAAVNNGAGAGSDINSNAGRMQSGTATYGQARRRLTTALTETDIDITVSITFDDASQELYPGVFFRAEETAFTVQALDSGYSLELDTLADAVKLYRVAADGTQTQLASAPKTITSATWHVHIECIGDAIRARVWLDGTTEPATWDIDTTDSTWSGGNFGLGLSGGNNTTNDIVRWDDLAISARNVIYRGFVAETRHDQSGGPFVGMATVDAVDLTGILAGYETALTGVPRETTGARVDRILDAIGIPAAWRSVATGYVEMAEPADGVLTVNALEHLQDCAEAEVGGLYTSAGGVLTFEDRYELLARLDSAAAYTFSDTPAGSDMRPLRALVLTPVGTDYRNLVQFIPDSGTAQVASNVPANTPPDALSRTLPIAEDSQALANAVLLLDVYRQTLTWPSAVTVPLHPDNESNLEQVTTMDLRTLVTVEHTPVGKTQQTYKTFVEHIRHRFGKGYWEATLGLSSADRWEDGWGSKNDYLILDDSSFGLLGTGKLAP